MPIKPKKPCAYIRCPNLTHSKYCEDHKHLLNREKKGNTERQQLYQTSQWKRLRLMQLHKEPLCRICKEHGRTESATHVDHIKDHKGDVKLFFDSGNLQSLCKPCHSKKTMVDRSRTVRGRGA